MEFTTQELLALRLLVLGKSRAEVAKEFGMTDTTFSRFMRRVYIQSGANGTLETAAKLIVLGHLKFQPSDFPDRWAGQR